MGFNYLLLFSAASPDAHNWKDEGRVGGRYIPTIYFMVSRNQVG